MENWQTWNIRVVLLGDSMVGKSTLVMRASGRHALPPPGPTIGIDYDRARVDMDGESVSLQLWDTAGQERFRSIVDGYYRGAACLLLCVACDSIESLRSVQEHWYPQAQSHNPQAHYAVVLTKADCNHGQVAQMTQAWAQTQQLPVFPTQALTHSVEPLLQWVARTCSADPPPTGVNRPLSVTAAPLPPPATSRECCTLM